MIQPTHGRIVHPSEKVHAFANPGARVVHRRPHGHGIVPVTAGDHQSGIGNRADDVVHQRDEKGQVLSSFERSHGQDHRPVVGKPVDGSGARVDEPGRSEMYHRDGRIGEVLPQSVGGGVRRGVNVGAGVDGSSQRLHHQNDVAMNRVRMLEGPAVVHRDESRMPRWWNHVIGAVHQRDVTEVSIRPGVIEASP